MSKEKKQKRSRLKNLREARVQMVRLAPYVFPFKGRLLLYLVATVAYWGGNMGRLFAIQPMMSALGAGGEDGSKESADALTELVSEYGGLGLALLIFGSGVLMALGTWGKQYHMNWLVSRASVDVQRQLAARIMQQPMTFFNTTSKGELLSRLTNDLGGVRSSLHIIYNDLVHHPIGIVMLLAGAIYTSPTLALTTIAVPLVLAPVLIFAGKIKRLAKRTYEKQAALTTFFHQYFEGVRVIKAYNMEDRQANELDTTAKDWFHQSVKVGKYQGGAKALVEIIMGVLMAGGMLLGFWLIDADGLGTNLTLPELVQFLAFLIALYDPVRRLSNTINQMSAAMAANERVFELMDRVPEVKDALDAREAIKLQESIRFDDVSFEYLEGRPVVRDITLDAPRGSMTAFVGATGAGKSTLMDLIPRFYLPTSGQILIDGVDLQKFTQESWLKQIAVVEQETFLFNASVRDNLMVAREDASEEDLHEALKAANIFDEVMGLPDGIDTELGDRGVMLSGGQRQRLAIARAFVKRAPILLLDEATSALDTETERKVQEALDRLIEGATVFAIAHRLSTIRHADQIIVLDQGEIIETGTHEELLAKNGRYALLYRTQHSDKEGA